MSFYNMLFGRNPQSGLLLAVVGLHECDIERFRDVSVSEDGATIEVYTRTGGGNREAYPNEVMRHTAGWKRSQDDYYDDTYCTDYFDVPEKWRADVVALSDVLANGLRKAFAKHLAKTIRRDPTPGQLSAQATATERERLSRTEHFMANGHTFVPKDDHAMKAALDEAEKRDNGKLLSCWGILPMRVNCERNVQKYGTFYRLDANYEWELDEEYWAHCQEKFGASHPKAMAAIAEGVARNLGAKP